MFRMKPDASKDAAFQRLQASAAGARSKPRPGPPTLRAAYSDRTAALMALLSAVAYIAEDDESADAQSAREQRAGYGFQNPIYFRSDLDDGVAILVQSEEMLVLAFRGTRSFANWKINIDFWPTQVLSTGANHKLRVHSGFYRAYLALADAGLAEAVAEFRRKTDRKLPIYVTGHSLGGALAQVATAVLGDDDIAACYTFGCPRIGNAYFDLWVKPPIYRILNYSDIVPQVPPPGIYRHAGDPRYLPREVDGSPFRFQPGIAIRGWQFLAGLWALLTSLSLTGVKDHSMVLYRTKLDQIADERTQQRSNSGSSVVP